MNTKTFTEIDFEPLGTQPVVGDRVIYTASQWTIYLVRAIAFVFQFPIRIRDEEGGLTDGVMPDYFNYSGTGNDWRIFKRKGKSNG